MTDINQQYYLVLNKKTRLAEFWLNHGEDNSWAQWRGSYDTKSDYFKVAKKAGMANSPHFWNYPNLPKTHEVLWKISID